MCKYIFVILLVTAVANCAKLPSYFQKCSKSDQKLNECLINSAKAAWPTMVEGDPSSHIQSMNPFFVPHLQANVDNNLKGNLTDAEFTGFKEMEIRDIKLDFDKKTLDIIIFFPRLNIKGGYEITGRLLFFPIEGEGPSNITFMNMENNIHIDFDIMKKSNKKYIEVKESGMKYTTTRGIFHLDNLFGGDARLGDAMNKVLDESWEAVNDEVGSKVGDAIGTAYGQVLQSFFRRVPLEEMFSD